MLLHLWSQLLFAIFLLSKDVFATDVILEVDNEDEKDIRRPIWNIAHMVNALYQVDLYLDLGANSLEFDIAFDTDGIARFTFHGFPCDCFRSCMRYENFDTYIGYLQHVTTPGDPLFREEFVLLFMDFKLKGLSQSLQVHAGEDVAMKLLDHYWRKGGRAYVLLSLPSIKHIGFIISFRKTLQYQNASEYDAKIGFDFSGNEDLDSIRFGLESAEIRDRIWQGDGITNCLPRGTGRLLAALNRRDLPGVTYINKVYWWTVDKFSTMRRTLSLGVDGLITNYPESLYSVLNEDAFSSKVRLATYEDNPWQKCPRRAATLISVLPQGRDFTDLDFQESEEILYNS